MKISTTAKTTTAAPATRSAAARHPCRSTTPASNGRNTSCPVAFAAESAPSTMPRRASNHRVATTAASTIDVTPVPVPTHTPHNSVTCHWLLHLRGERDGDGEERQGGDHEPPQAPSVHRRRGEGSDQAEQRDVDRDGGRNHGAAPPELGFERHHEQARRGANTGRDEQRQEGDGRDDPRVVQSRSRGAGLRRIEGHGWLYYAARLRRRSLGKLPPDQRCARRRKAEASLPELGVYRSMHNQKAP